MDKFDRIQKLHRLLLSHKHPVPMSKLEKEFECGVKTIKRTIETMQIYLQAPIKYNKEHKGWYYDLKEGQTVELPSLWLTTNELQSLSAVLSILHSMDEGFLGKEVSVIENQISKLLAARNIDFEQFGQRIKFLPMLKQHHQSDIFELVCEALLQRKQLTITYKTVSGISTERNISPQTLAYYRENWYLDCWCHLRQNLRTFSVARIISAEKIKRDAKEISKTDLQSHFASSYGIFAGKAKHTAKLKFYPEIAPHIASQQWHPQQTGEWQGQYYILSFPYGDDRELILDILKYGNNVEVLKPAKLKNAIIARLRGALDLYQ